MAYTIIHAYKSIKTGRFFSKTSQGILIHAFSRFGRRLNALCFCLVFGHIFAHISQFFRLRRPSGGPPGALWGTSRGGSPEAPPGGLRATDAGPLINALLHIANHPTKQTAQPATNPTNIRIVTVVINLDSAVSSQDFPFVFFVWLVSVRGFRTRYVVIAFAYLYYFMRTVGFRLSYSLTASFRHVYGTYLLPVDRMKNEDTACTNVAEVYTINTVETSVFMFHKIT